MLALRDASQRIAAASAALAGVGEAGEDRVAAISNTIRSLEEGLGSLRVALLASKSVETEMVNALMVSQADLGNLLAILAALESTPAPLSIIHPEGATASARAGIILAAVTPKLRARADSLRAELSTISTLHTLHNQALGNLQTALTTLQNARNELAVAIREEMPLPANPTDSNDNLDRLVRASEDLDELAAQLGAGLPDTPNSAGNAPQRGRLALPVNGIITKPFNAPNGAGIRQPGIVITAPPLSLVSAPQPSTVRFSGDFLEYGHVVILEPALQQLQIYAGFGQVYVNTGDVLETGAVMGLLGGEIPDSAEFLAEGSGENDNSAESLYIEIRENGNPVDPTLWFAVN